MASPAIGAFVNINHTSRITDPPAVVFKDTHAIAPTLSAYELDELSCGSRYNGPSSKELPSGAATPLSPKELEMSRPPSPKNDEAVDVVQSLSNPPMNRYRLISACLMCFGNGLNDSAPGALIPYMESDYKIGYALVSLIFVTNALGFISAAPFTDLLGARLGRAKALILAETLMIVSYIALVCAPPFPVVAISFFLTGLGLALNLALNNVFCANLADPATTLGAFHGSYGVGGTIGPLIATALGAEVSISGWVISFLLTYRHSSPRSTGYVTAGFWAGITLGRFGLTHLAHHLGERSSVAGLTALAVLFQLLVWFVPNVVGDGVAVAVSVVGAAAADEWVEFYWGDGE
ncbi:Major facilitator superfamily domain, general substrate transporter [Lasallia pustulata]|uniref:Major facilitator superfamily domain, general substrate transporter n=1 Tax=Lasallia pustulata TaxID=136370 RepID=A0A1W5DBF8_9LECA|nr:Major facilitator superfamily domain, general substrate transporter [Lasallia pustulata]